jgi:hypothetical protein
MWFRCVSGTTNVHRNFIYWVRPSGCLLQNSTARRKAASRFCDQRSVTTGEDIMSVAQVSVPQNQPASPVPAVGALARTGFAPARRPSVELASSRAFATNPNHHLWRNGRLWWIAFTLIHDGWRQERVRQSLGTDNVLEARRRRDAILSLFAPVASDGCVDPEPEAVRN